MSATLSIVIPTYNRAPLLRCLLESIVDDFAEWPSDLELVVLDNASTDGTGPMLEDFRRRHPPLTVHRGPENIGMDGNLAACFGAASGDYFWQIGDDELLFRGTASWVLDFCRGHRFGLLHLAHDSFEAGAQTAQRARARAEPVRVVRASACDLIRRANIFLTFISANVVNRRLLLSQRPDFDPRVEMRTHLPQLAWIYGVLCCSDEHHEVTTPMFGALTGNTGGYRLVEVFGRNLDGITGRRLEPSFPSARRLIANAALLRLFPPQLVAQARQSAGASFVAEDVAGTMERLYRDRFYYRWLVRPIVRGGAWRREAAFFAVRIVNRIDRLVGHALL